MATNRNMVMGIGGLATVGILLFFAGDLGELAGRAIGIGKVGEIGTPEQNALVENAYAVQINHDQEIDLLVTPVWMGSNDEPDFAAAVMDMVQEVDRFYRLTDENEWEGFDGQYYYDDRVEEFEPETGLYATAFVLFTIYRVEGLVDGTPVDFNSFYLQFTENGSTFCHYTDPMFPDIQVDVENLNCTPTPGRGVQPDDDTIDVTPGKSAYVLDTNPGCQLEMEEGKACNSLEWECPPQVHHFRVCNDTGHGGMDGSITLQAAAQIRCKQLKNPPNPGSMAGSCMIENVAASSAANVFLTPSHESKMGDCKKHYETFKEGSPDIGLTAELIGEAQDGEKVTGGHVFVDKQLGIRDSQNQSQSSSFSIEGHCTKKVNSGSHSTSSDSNGEGGDSSGSDEDSSEGGAGINAEWHRNSSSEMGPRDRINVSVGLNTTLLCTEGVVDPVMAPGGGGTSVGGGSGTGGDSPETDGSGGDSMGGNPKGGGH
jgi:hypothetical protein